MNESSAKPVFFLIVRVLDFSRLVFWIKNDPKSEFLRRLRRTPSRVIWRQIPFPDSLNVYIRLASLFLRIVLQGIYTRCYAHESGETGAKTREGVRLRRVGAPTPLTRHSRSKRLRAAWRPETPCSWIVSFAPWADRYAKACVLLSTWIRKRNQEERRAPPMHGAGYYVSLRETRGPDGVPPQAAAHHLFGPLVLTALLFMPCSVTSAEPYLFFGISRTRDMYVLIRILFPLFLIFSYTDVRFSFSVAKVSRAKQCARSSTVSRTISTRWVVF